MIVVCVLAFVVILVAVIAVVVWRRRGKVPVSDGTNVSINGEENVSAIVSQDSTSNQEIAAQKVDDPRVTKKWLTRNFPSVDFN